MVLDMTVGIPTTLLLLIAGGAALLRLRKVRDPDLLRSGGFLAAGILVGGAIGMALPGTLGAASAAFIASAAGGYAWARKDAAVDRRMSRLRGAAAPGEEKMGVILRLQDRLDDLASPGRRRALPVLLLSVLALMLVLVVYADLRPVLVLVAGAAILPFVELAEGSVRQEERDLVQAEMDRVLRGVGSGHMGGVVDATASGGAPGESTQPSPRSLNPDGP